jgi:site-specific recombinase XerD
LLSNVPPEVEWFADIEKKNTRRAYFKDIKTFMSFLGIQNPQELRQVTRAHIIAWRKTLITFSPATIRRKLSALTSLFDYLCESNAILYNPAHGVKRPKGKSEVTKSLSDNHVRVLLNTPPEKTLKGKRDRAILSVLFYHALRREELSNLRVKDYYVLDRDVPHFRIRGKGDKDRYIPMHPASIRLIQEYLEVSGHKYNTDAPLFLIIKNNNPSGCIGTVEQETNHIYNKISAYFLIHTFFI